VEEAQPFLGMESARLTWEIEAKDDRDLFNMDAGSYVLRGQVEQLRTINEGMGRLMFKTYLLKKMNLEFFGNR